MEPIAITRDDGRREREIKQGLQVTRAVLLIQARAGRRAVDREDVCVERTGDADARRLDARVERAMIGQGSTLDSTDASIDTPGSVGFSGGIGDVDAGYAYDNFTRQAL